MASGRKPLMRSLGEFVGHIVRAVKTDPAAARREAGATAPPPAPSAVRTETTAETRETPLGPVTLRRTTIEEITLPRPPEGPG